MSEKFADLHVHTFYSDGSMSPEEIAEEAVKNNVGLLAVADHDLITGSLEVRGLCETRGIKYIPAAEISSIDGGVNFHILAYGFDVDNREFLDFLSHTRFMLDESSVKLIELMQKDYDRVSFDEYMNFAYDRRLGGWKALHYLLEKGLSSSLKESAKFYPQYGVSYDKAGFPSIYAIAYRIRKAGGYSVLAHPGELIDSSDISAFKSELARVMSNGLDGIECYYPTHSDEVTRVCLDYCGENNLMTTAGSDCHGVFGRTRVGEMNIPISKLELGKLFGGF